jgi:hypothetical protein
MPISDLSVVLGNILSDAKTEAQWTNDIRILPYGYIAVSFDALGNKKIKIGDGTKTWSELDFFERGGGSNPSPDLTNISGLFLSDNGSVDGFNWHNVIPGGADLSLTDYTRGDDTAVILGAGDKGHFTSGTSLNAFYCVCKIPTAVASRTNTIVGIETTNVGASGRAAEIELMDGLTGAENVELTCNGKPYVGDSVTDVTQYHAYAYMYAEKVNTYGYNGGYLFVDGMLLGVRADENVSDASLIGTGWIGVGRRSNNFYYPIQYPTHYLAVGFGKNQTAAQVIQNTNWLMWKFGLT